MQANDSIPTPKNQLEISPISPSNDFLKNKGSLASIPVKSIIADPIFQMREKRDRRCDCPPVRRSHAE